MIGVDDDDPGSSDHRTGLRILARHVAAAHEKAELLEVVAQRPRVAILRHHQKGVLAARLAKANAAGEVVAATRL